jgi:hypothetical protein
MIPCIKKKKTHRSIKVNVLQKMAADKFAVRREPSTRELYRMWFLYELRLSPARPGKRFATVLSGDTVASGRSSGILQIVR